MVISTYGLVADPVAWQIVCFGWPWCLAVALEPRVGAGFAGAGAAFAGATCVLARAACFARPFDCLGAGAGAGADAGGAACFAWPGGVAPLPLDWPFPGSATAPAR